MPHAPFRPRRFDVVLAPVLVGECNDARRCVVLEVDSEHDLVILQPCSSQGAMFDEWHDMWIDGTETNSPKEGFMKRTYAIGPKNPKLDGLVGVFTSEIRRLYRHLCPEQEQQLKERYAWD